MSIKESLPLKMHMCIHMCIYIILTSEEFWANLCSIPPRKCHTSLQQIQSMMQQCLRRWWYYFRKVYRQFMQHVFKKYSNSATKVFLSAQHYSQVVFQHVQKTSVNTADHSFEKCIFLSKKIMPYIQWTYENQRYYKQVLHCHIFQD